MLIPALIGGQWATNLNFAAGVLKLPGLFGPAGVGAYLSVRFLVRYLRTRTLTPFGSYCTVAGLAALAYLTLVK